MRATTDLRHPWTRRTGRRALGPVALAVCVCLGLLGLGMTTAQAAYRVVEATMPSSTSDGNSFNLCWSECVRGISTTAPEFGRSPEGKALNSSDGYYAGNTLESLGDRVQFANVVAGGYRVAVRYADGKYRAWGYLKTATGGYELTKNWAEASVINVPESGSMGVFNIIKTTPKPEPTPVQSAAGHVSLILKGEYRRPGGQIGFCRVSCLDGTGAIVAGLTGAQGRPATDAFAAGTTDYYIDEFPSGSYKVAVVFNDVARGYLVRSGDLFKLTADFGAAASFSDLYRDWEVLVGTRPSEPSATYGLSAPMWGGSFSYFEYRVTRAEPHTTVKAEVIGCRGTVVASKVVSGRGAFNFRIYPKPARMGKNWRLRTTISAPGRTTYVSVLNNYIGARYFPACPGGQSANPKCFGRTIAQWRATGRNVIVGNGAANRLVGSRGSDVILGLGGNDRIFGGGGRDVICGGSGHDLIRGQAGADLINGEAGDDRIHGDSGIDTIHGGSGADSVFVRNRDKDRAYGGTGRDRAWADRSESVVRNFEHVYRG